MIAGCERGRPVVDTLSFKRISLGIESTKASIKRTIWVLETVKSKFKTTPF